MKRKEIIRRLTKVADHLTVLESARRVVKAGINSRVSNMLNQALAALHDVAADKQMRKASRKTSKELKRGKRKKTKVNVNDGINALLGAFKAKPEVHVAGATIRGSQKPSKNKGGPKPSKDKKSPKASKRQVSAAGRARIAEGQKRRWKLWRKENKPHSEHGKVAA